MTKEDIIKLAREAEGTPYVNRHYPGLTSFGFNETTLAAFAKLVAEAEREACAKVCDEFQARDVGMQPAECAGAIRARS